jgi:hypothetical protein
MWPQQAADKTKMWHNFMTLPGLQIFKNLSELVSEREREKKNQRTTYTYDTCCKTQDTKNQNSPNLKQV